MNLLSKILCSKSLLMLGNHCFVSYRYVSSLENTLFYLLPFQILAENPQYSSDDELDTLVSIRTPSFSSFSVYSHDLFCVTLQIRQEKPYYSPNPELDSLVSISFFYVVLHDNSQCFGNRKILSVGYIPTI